MLKTWISPKLIAVAILWAVLPIRLEAGEMAFQILHEFGPGDGPQIPRGPLIEGQDGSFYTTSKFGGGWNYGTLFKITPQGDVTLLHEFEPVLSNGVACYLPGNVVQTANGDFYGLALASFEQTPSFGSVLYRFRTNDSNFALVAQYHDPYGPQGWLTSDGGTNLYNLGYDSVFRFTTNGSLTLLFAFNGTNGAYLAGRVLPGENGMIYGTTSKGGSNYSGGYTGDGTVFRLSANGELTTLVLFGTTNGSVPYSYLNWGRDGQIYGTTFLGGTDGGTGTVFRVTTNGTLTTLATFYGTNGAYPVSGVLQAPNGKFYGVTSGGFANTNTPNGEVGSVFSLTTNGALTTIVRFNGTNALNPVADLTLARDGNLYGVATDLYQHQSLNGNSGLFFRLAQVPEITTTILTNDVVWLEWTSFTNGVYQVEGKDPLANSDWAPLSSNLTATGNRLSFSTPTADFAQRFYRVVLLP